MEMALAHYGIRLHHSDHQSFRGLCPLPTHAPDASHHSFMVNTAKNAWACHSDSCIAARGGRIGGNVLDFVAAMESCSLRDAALRLQDWLLAIPSATCAARNVNATPTDPTHNEPLPFILNCVDPTHPYLAARGVDIETARHFGIGYDCGTGLMAGRVVFPIHDEGGALVAYAGRAIGQAGPKYRFPPRFRKSLVLFNLHRAAVMSKSVIVVEGFFDCIRVHQAGIPCVVALMGRSLSAQQEDLLRRHFDHVTLLLDGDQPGRTAGAAIATRLVSQISTRLALVPDGTQPDQLDTEHIRLLCVPGYF